MVFRICFLLKKKEKVLDVILSYRVRLKLIVSDQEFQNLKITLVKKPLLSLFLHFKLDCGKPQI